MTTDHDDHRTAPDAPKENLIHFNPWRDFNDAASSTRYRARPFGHDPDKCIFEVGRLRLRGLDPESAYEVTDLDGGEPRPRTPNCHCSRTNGTASA